jgi:DNA repair protein RadA/Sms
MAKVKTRYVCQSCGATASKWSGQCVDCSEWNTIEEVKLETSRPGGIRTGYAGQTAELTVMDSISLEQVARGSTGSNELDRVLGGGLVDGSAVLIGGDPGIGKSTLLLQVMTALSQSMSALYITGEESLQQVAMRARRLQLPGDKLQLLPETHIETILATAHKAMPKVMVVDSIQTVYTDQLNSAPGGVAQVRESAASLVRFAKQTGTALFLVGHVTKEGALAGPRVLEHMVDSVLYFEGEADGRYRMLRAVKNRFGAVNELGVFAMTDTGLKGVNNPSAIFLSRYDEPVPGSSVMVTREGTRPMLVEVQALVDDSQLSNPRRVAVGVDQSRLAMLLAVLHRHGGISAMGQDVFINVVGGVKVSETASDLAVLISVVSSIRGRPISKDLIVFGEVGLSGEIRPVANGAERLKEATKQGFKKCILPFKNVPKDLPEGVEVTGVKTLAEALDVI